jgi:hypothetical protein
MKLNRRVIVRLATVGLLAAGALAVPSPAQALAPCVDPLDYYFLGGGREGASWMKNAYLWASDSRYCKYNGDYYVYATGGAGTEYLGRRDFAVPRS